MGPVISLRHLRRIEEVIHRSTDGAILTGGERMSGMSSLDGFDFSRGSFFPPTVIAGLSIEDELWKEEIFGPIVVVVRFSVGLRCGSPCRLFTDSVHQAEGDAVRLANNCRYGLGAGIWTQNLSKAHRISADIESGICWVNTHHRNDPSSPWYAPI
jgi:acyl-CoA reductase-like NAD-dependent aldehyde dehydrogenase